MYKVLYDKSQNKHSPDSSLSIRDIRAIQDLMGLWEDSDSPTDVPLSTSDTQGPTTSVLFKPKSKNFRTLGSNSNILAFVQQATKEVEEIAWSQTGPGNLPLTLRKAISTLQENVDKVIKLTDKGGNLVVMDRNHYELIMNLCSGVVQTYLPNSY